MAEATIPILEMKNAGKIYAQGSRRIEALRGAGFRDGRWRDGVLYSVLRDEVDLTSTP